MDLCMTRVLVRDERGMTGVGLVIGVIVAAALIAIPLVMMARSQQERTEHAVGALEGAEGVAAEVTLNLAVRAASTYFAERGSFSGLTPQVAASIEPGVRWGAARLAVPGEVSIRAVGPGALVLVTADRAGDPSCAVMRGTTATFGKQDAHTPNACLPSP
jgi:hypothetical protein